MANISLIYNKNIVKNAFNRDIGRSYFAIPVYPVKVLLTYDKKPELNHFERVIISLLLSGKYYTLEEIQEIITIDIDLIDLILNDLTEKGFIDENRRVTEKGEDVLKGLYKEHIQEVKYLFYDINRDVLIEGSDDSNSLEMQNCYIQKNNENSNNLEDYENTIKIDTDYSTTDIRYSILSFNKANVKINEDYINKQINKQKIDKENVKVMIAAKGKVIDKTIYLLTYLETSMIQTESSRWYVVNPITIKPDYELQNYLYSIKSKNLYLMIENLTNSRRVKLNYENREQLINSIKNNLFNRQVSQKHNYFIESLLVIFNSLNVEAKFGENGKLMESEKTQSAMVYLGDMFENILYQYAIENDYLKYIDVFNNDSNRNQITLELIAKTIGFNLSNNTNNLFKLNKNCIKSNMKKIESAKINTCLAINLVMAYDNKDHFFHKLVKVCPNYLVEMYNFKRNIRDKARHEENFIDVSPKEYVDLIILLLDLAFGYKCNNDELNKMFMNKNSFYDYSYVNEFVRYNLGTEFLESNNENIISIRTNLIQMIKKILEKQTSYIGSLRIIIENNILKKLINKLSNFVKIDNSFDIKQFFNSENDLEKYLVSLGFTKSLTNNSDNNLHNSLVIDNFTNKYIIEGYKTGFTNTNLRYRLQALIVFMKINNNVKEYILNLNNKNFFAIISAVMYFDKSHKQNAVFNTDNAKLLENEILELIRNIMSSNLLDWR